MKSIKNAGLLLGFIGVAFLPALGAIAVKTDGWYQTLNKPVWNPPAWIFGPVWTALYLMIGLAGYFAWTRSSRNPRKTAFTAFSIQLILNAIWTPLFFGLHQIGGALAILILLWIMILLCIGLFSRCSRLAVWLLIPYFLWVSFAGALNAVLWILN